MTYSITLGKLPEIEKEDFEKMNNGYMCTGETLREEFPDGSSTTYVVMRTYAPTCNWTPHGMCRDCGDHYIIARWSRYDRIEKHSFKLTVDTDDK